MRCTRCPAGDGLRCRGESIRRFCELVASGRDDYRRFVADNPDHGPIPEAGPAPPAPGPDNEALLANAEACPRRAPIPEAERTPCGCTHRCLDGRGPRHRKGGVLLLDCWGCPIAPRRASP